MAIATASPPARAAVRWRLWIAPFGVVVAAGGAAAGLIGLVAGGLLLALVGFTLAVRPLLNSAARRSDGWPLPLRLGVRDAQRNVRRTVPAVAVTAVALASTIAAGSVLALPRLKRLAHSTPHARQRVPSCSRQLPCRVLTLMSSPHG